MGFLRSKWYLVCDIIDIDLVQIGSISVGLVQLFLGDWEMRRIEAPSIPFVT
jgi:hypothetical protein